MIIVIASSAVNHGFCQVKPNNINSMCCFSAKNAEFRNKDKDPSRSTLLFTCNF